MKDTTTLIQDAIDHLTLASYAAKRRRNPEIAPERWATIFGTEEQKKLEKAFQVLDNHTKINILLIMNNKSARTNFLHHARLLRSEGKRFDYRAQNFRRLH